jgi:hypothetical protein
VAEAVAGGSLFALLGGWGFVQVSKLSSRGLTSMNADEAIVYWKWLSGWEKGAMGVGLGGI